MRLLRLPRLAAPAAHEANHHALAVGRVDSDPHRGRQLANDGGGVEVGPGRARPCTTCKTEKQELVNWFLGLDKTTNAVTGYRVMYVCMRACLLHVYNVCTVCMHACWHECLYVCKSNVRM